MKRHGSVAIGFLALIALGAVFLASPVARNSGEWGAFGDAAFTACSAVCVTGLTVVDIASEYSLAGQIGLLVLVELGCLGLMTFGTFLLIAMGRRLSLGREFTLANAYGTTGVYGLKGLIVWTVGSMLAIETAGALAYWWRTRDVYLSIFYSVMSFCNAGFSILPGSLERFADDPWLVAASGILTITGGLGFLVLYNICTFRFLRVSHCGRGRLSLHTKTVLKFTAILLAVAFAVFAAAEWNHALAGMDFAKKISVAAYQAVTPRTCGFCIVATESLQPVTRLLYEVMMFIGGAPGSAAAGMKITTFAVLVYTLTAMCRGETETVMSKRLIPVEIVRESIVIFMSLAALAILVTAALLVTESGTDAAPEALFFEAVSAVTTTGLSVGGTTAGLSAAGRAVAMAAMFAGRLGALTVVMMIGDRESNRRIRFPAGELVVG